MVKCRVSEGDPTGHPSFRILAATRRTKEFRMDEAVIEPNGSHEPEGVRTPKKAAIAAWIGSVLEY